MRHRLKILGLVLSLCCSFLVHAQTPGMVYQATLLHPQGVSMPGENIILEHLRHQKVSIRFSITDASLDVVYTEEHSSTTNAYGEVKIELGSGVAVFGDFQDILWNGDDKQLNVEIDYGWGTGYELFHTQSMYYLPHPLNPFDQERVSSNTDLLNYIIEGAGFDPYANYISKPLDSILENAFSLAESDRDLDEAVHENTESIASFKDDQKIEHLSLSDMRLQIALEGSDDFYVNLSSLRDGIGTDAQKASDVTLVVEGWMTKSDVEIKNLQSAIIQLNEDLDRLNNNNSDEQTMSLDGEELQLTGSQTSVLLRNYLNQVDRQKAQEVLLVETMDFDADGASEATVEEALIALSNRLSMGCTDSSACNYFSLAKADDGSCIFLMDCQTCSGETNGKGRVVENFKDDCGVCDGDNTSCADCAGVPNGSSWESDCGCVAEGNSGDDCDDCTGVPNGTASPDACGVCEGNGPLNNADCDGNCLPGFTDVNGVCVTVEEGCMESIACNYNSSVNTDDGSCIYNDEFSKDEISCDAYTWNGKVITESGTHVDTLQTTSGCDSVVTLNLTINESIRTTDTQEHCDAYTWIDGLEYTADNATATHTLKTTSGCDSVVALNLTINESIRTTDTQEHCDAYTWIDGLEYTADNATATHTLKTTSGCDSVVALNLTINESIRTTDTQEHCDAYTWIDGLEYTADNATATHTLKTTSGCDSVVALNLTINESIRTTDTQEHCDAYTWIDGLEYTADNATATHTLKTTSGCDSVVALNLTINESIRTTDTQEHCDAYTWIDGLEYTADNATATHTLKTTSGCDSVVALNLTINESIRTTDTQEHCDAYTWIDGLEYTADNATATHTLKTTSGCDSVVALNLTINESIRTTDTQEHCDAYTWIDGLEYTADNATATHTLKTTSGCDSVVALNLTINESIRTTDTQEHCDAYTWIDGLEYTADNATATHTLKTTSGCDSVVALNLTINESIRTTDTQEHCDAYTWIDGLEYTADNATATHTLKTTSGCDSVVALNLTINESIRTTDTQEHCDAYTWIDGLEYTADNATATHTLKTTSGCDSVVALNLTINESIRTTDTQEHCDAYTWNGKVITESGTHVDTLQTASGCDSVVALNLTINESIRTTDTQEHCDAYTWNGKVITESGTHVDTLQTASGCDSVVALNLTINESTSSIDIQEHCDAYTWNGKVITESGTHVDTLQTASGCDSVVALNLTINESIRTTDTQEHCDAYTWIDGLEYTADNATATHTLKTTSGCDSVVSLNLLINKKSDDCDICVAGKFESSDTDNDGVCDEDEIEGCTNTNACNYNSSATESVECDYTKTYWKDEDGDESGYGDGVSLCLDEVKDGYVSHCSTLSAMYCFDDSCDKNYKINKSSFPLWSYPHGVSYNTNIFTCSGDFIDNNDHGAGVRVFSLGKVNGIHEKVYAFSVSNESYYKFYNSTALNYSASVSSKVYTNTWELPTEDWITEFRNDVKAQVFWDYVPTEFWTDIPCAGGYEIYNKDAKTYSCSDNSNAYPYIRIIEIKPNY